MAACNLAVSIKHYSPDLPIYLLHDDRVFSKGNFDLSLFSDTKLIEPDYAHPANTKADIYDYLPYDENLFMDVDAICLKDVRPLFEELKDMNYAVTVAAVYDKNSPEVFSNLPWANKSVIWQHFNLPQDAKLPSVQSSIQFIRKSDETKKIFDQLKSNLRNEIPLNKLRNQWGGSQPDELYLDVALAQLGVNPHIGDHAILFTHSMQKEDGRTLSLSEIREKFYFMSLYGSKLDVKPIYKTFYDNLLIGYYRELGQNHRYKSHFVLTGKHADKPQKKYNENPLEYTPVNTSKINLFVSWYTPKTEKREKELLKIIELNRGAKIFLISEQPFRNIPNHVTTVSVPKRPTYTDMFRIANEYSDEDTISIVANADIEFNSQCLEKLSSIDYTDTVLALTRWEKKNNSILSLHGMTQDAWIFKGKIDCRCDVEMGIPACDHIVGMELSKKYNVINPSLDIKIWHYDSKKTYSNSDRLVGLYKVIPPHKINQTPPKGDKLLIIQPGHFGDIIICLPIAKYYSSFYQVEWYCPKKYHELFRNVDYCKPVDRVDFGKIPYDAVLDLSFGLLNGDINDWWVLNEHKFNSFIEAKYFIAGLDLKNRWNLEIDHDKAKEQRLLEKLNPSGGEYALCHEQSDYKRKYTFNTNLNKILFGPITGYNIFDWYEVIVNASEIHCIDSSLANYVEVIPEAYKIRKTLSPWINGGSTPSLYTNNWSLAEESEKYLKYINNKPNVSIAEEVA